MGAGGGAQIKTAGTSKYTAEEFFALIQEATVSSFVDTRLRSSQLSGFARKQDLPFLVEHLLNVPYIFGASLAPTNELLSAFKKKRIDWQQYERDYLELLASRKDQVLEEVKLWGSNPVLVCSEYLPEYCHRRLAAEYLIDLGIFERVDHLVK